MAKSVETETDADRNLQADYLQFCKWMNGESYKNGGRNEGIKVTDLRPMSLENRGAQNKKGSWQEELLGCGECTMICFWLSWWASLYLLDLKLVYFAAYNLITCLQRISSSVLLDECFPNYRFHPISVMKLFRDSLATICHSNRFEQKWK